MADELAKIWVISNRVDDRVVLFERDPEHPGGEAFIGGSGPDYVARTPAVEAVLRSGEALEIPEPPDGPKKPLVGPDLGAAPPPDQPGRVTHLGRVMDPDLVPEGAAKSVESQQKRAGEEIPVPAGTIVPPAPPPATSRARS